MKKRMLSLGLALAMALSLLSGCGGAPADPTPVPTAEPTPSPSAEASPSPSASAGGDVVRLAMLNGPTGVGAAKLLADSDAGETLNQYEVTLASDPATEIAPALSNGTLDIAAISTNLAANLYQKGVVQVLALNTLGVLYILENGDTVHSMADLAGKTIYATGQGSNPEYVLNYLLEQNGLTPGEDVTIEWKASDELTSLMASGQIDLCMLPVPAATAVMNKNADVRSALDLTEEWDAATDGQSVLTMGCVVARTGFIQEHPEAVQNFLTEYAASIAYVSNPDNLEEAAKLVAQYGITASEEIALKAIPDCNLVCITGDAIREGIQGYYEVLFEADPASIGGAIPDDQFYYLG